ncbi:DUF1127 domain-containing protein [Salmonella enterica]|uniref:DUF1127 domain-containing protein n=1 Tax=Salmonella enterica subsp. enterica serovar Rubislaw str. ATCC 10717 TaxID=938143 RepID=A0A6W0P099_SALRU|nr:DUF1127 domain-containing protein [Salmonella enterica]EBY1810345.1 DUF1127 domain-containing protein [Salmonella enterica subsp. enterica serovar Rubislaw]ECS6156117.1 DUF1127 domain-containing protein [Salmonella enterica subsp. enterica serovar Javiana]EDI4631332.1 DUF1127 domain-containing protein [Salmonella enterica subsp. enterica serovar Poona]EDJ9214266.1 DUF1127 domain-containing protein [Salmonella enterica subsp. enterica serovar Bareilly]EDT7187158.1 DUF1127 domain-containing p
MEFHENRAKQPFIGFVLIWQAFKKWRAQAKRKLILQHMSEERLKDLGLRRDKNE